MCHLQIMYLEETGETDNSANKGQVIEKISYMTRRTSRSLAVQQIKIQLIQRTRPDVHLDHAVQSTALTDHTDATVHDQTGLSL